MPQARQGKEETSPSPFALAELSRGGMYPTVDTDELLYLTVTEWTFLSLVTNTFNSESVSLLLLGSFLVELLYKYCIFQKTDYTMVHTAAWSGRRR